LYLITRLVLSLLHPSFSQVLVHRVQQANICFVIIPKIKSDRLDGGNSPHQNITYYNLDSFPSNSFSMKF
jgi:hypothetical protein